MSLIKLYHSMCSDTFHALGNDLLWVHVKYFQHLQPKPAIDWKVLNSAIFGDSRQMRAC